MKQKLLWFDLVVCSVWALAVLGCTSWWRLPAHFLILLTVISRIAVAFVLDRGDKRGWVTLSLFLLLTFFVIEIRPYFVISDIGRCLFNMFGIDIRIMALKFEEYSKAYMIISYMMVAWLWIIPFVIYIVKLCRKRLVRTELSRMDLAGAILWHDHRAGMYSLLMLVATLSLYSGLAMDPRVCWFVCLAAPTLSLWLLSQYFHVDISKLWVIIVAMGVFYYAQTHNGLARISMLGVSIIMVAYICSRFYTEKGLLAIAALTTIYIGILLPSLSVGNNQYTCINYSRKGFYTFSPFSGIFFVNDVTGEKIGLRDRYGLLVEPKYEQICWHDKAGLLEDIELRKNGYVTNYELLGNHISFPDDICHELQDSICNIIENHLPSQSYNRNERIEIKVKDYLTGDLLSHVKGYWRNGVDYDYNTSTFISEDTVSVKSGDFVCDSIVEVGARQRQVIHYSFDVIRKSKPVYNISIKTARDKMSERDELIGLKDKIVETLKYDKEWLF